MVRGGAIHGIVHINIACIVLLQCIPSCYCLLIFSWCYSYSVNEVADLSESLGCGWLNVGDLGEWWCSNADDDSTCGHGVLVARREIGLGRTYFKLHALRAADRERRDAD